MDNWIEIFKVGTHKDSKGRERTFTTDDLDKMIQAYNPANSEAPAVIGQPKANDPAYGWVADLKRVGDHLMAKFKQVVPEFAAMMDQGMFKKRSIRVTPAGALGHVAFHGAAAPAIKGLGSFEFETCEEYMDYEESTNDPEFAADTRLAEKMAAHVNRNIESNAAEEHLEIEESNPELAADIRLAGEMAAYSRRAIAT